MSRFLSTLLPRTIAGRVVGLALVAIIAACANGRLDFADPKAGVGTSYAYASFVQSAAWARGQGSLSDTAVTAISATTADLGPYCSAPAPGPVAFPVLSGLNRVAVVLSTSPIDDTHLPTFIAPTVSAILLLVVQQLGLEDATEEEMQLAWDASSEACLAAIDAWHEAAPAQAPPPPDKPL